MKRLVYLALFVLCFLPLTVGAAGPTVVMCDPTVPVPDDLVANVRDALVADRPALTASYVISHYSRRDDTYLVSVVAIPDSFECEGWSVMNDGMWHGMVAVRDVTAKGRGLSTAPNADVVSENRIAGVMGSNGFGEIVEGTDLPEQSKSDLVGIERLKKQKNQLDTLGALLFRFLLPQPLAAPSAANGGSSTFYFPWESGKEMYMGTGGIHGSSTWPAVDFFSGFEYGSDAAGPYVYGITNGTMSYVCNDTHNTGFIATTSGDGGDLFYIHLVEDDSIAEGESVVRGSYVGALVAGTFEGGPCNMWASQLQSHYHLHLGFKPEIGTGGKSDTFQIEDWILHLDDTRWYRGSETRGIGQWITAEWSGSSSPPPYNPPTYPTPHPGQPTPVPPGSGQLEGDYFFDGIVGWIVDQAEDRKSRYPEDENEIGLSVTTARGVAVGARIMFVMIRSNFNLTVTLVAIAAMIILEGVFIIYQLYMLIKNAIPLVG